MSGLGSGRPFACRLSGAFKAEHDGYYIFFLSADHVASIGLNGRRLVQSKGGQERSFVVPPKKGFHPIELDYFHDQGDRFLTLNYLPLPEANELARVSIPIPAEFQHGRFATRPLSNATNSKQPQ